ncbi:thioredoxin family protein [Rosistilla oblonga]|uniref:Thiol-disulfide oxidoreductase n=1 Tax=Rosistilla oblonga TaxID=2527990 RepID=A0A518IUZ5_9BACT|nr:thioredoxin family protein [Rosistilla oblonga]QDV56912.1 thiol-disulfide oxidoreductase [Rosistilla oblonga]
MLRSILPYALLLLVISPAWAGEFNQVLSIGDAAPTWNDLPGIDDDKHGLDDWKQAEVVVIAFTCNSCPYATDVEQRLIALTKDYKDHGVAVVAINSNKVPDDELPAMKERAATAKFNFAYLSDPTQQTAKAYGAITTPEFYVLDKERRVVYMGAMDDSPDGKQIEHPYVRQAIDAALTGGKPAVAETVPIGCRIRFQRVRRKR